MAAQSDQIEMIARELWRQAMTLGWSPRVGWDDGHAVGRLAKASGSTPEQVEAWMRGDAQPPTNAALQILNALPLPETRAAAAAMNGAAHG